jgi:hypothetical protein
MRVTDSTLLLHYEGQSVTAVGAIIADCSYESYDTHKPLIAWETFKVLQHYEGGAVESRLLGIIRPEAVSNYGKARITKV